MPDTDRGQGPAAASEGHGAGEHTEAEAPRAEAAELCRRPRQARRRGFSWRTPAAALLIVAGCVLAPVSVLAVWTANQVSDTGRYVANMAPLIKDPAIQGRAHRQAHQPDRHQDRCERADRSGGRRAVKQGLRWTLPRCCAKYEPAARAVHRQLPGMGEVREFADQSKHRRRALHHLAGMRFGSFRRPIDRPGMTS